MSLIGKFFARKYRACYANALDILREFDEQVDAAKALGLSLSVEQQLLLDTLAFTLHLAQSDEPDRGEITQPEADFLNKVFDESRSLDEYRQLVENDQIVSPNIMSVAPKSLSVAIYIDEYYQRVLGLEANMVEVFTSLIDGIGNAIALSEGGVTENEMNVIEQYEKMLDAEAEKIRPGIIAKI